MSATLPEIEALLMWHHHTDRLRALLERARTANAPKALLVHLAGNIRVAEEEASAWARQTDTTTPENPR